MVRLKRSKSKDPTEGADPSINVAAQQPASRDAKSRTTLMALIAGGCLVTAWMNLNSSVVHVSHSAAAVNQAMEEFKQGGVGSKQQQNLQPQVEQPEEKVTVAQATTAAPPLDPIKNESPQSSESKIAKLSCEKFGGPDDEYASQEMVYWSDIPSDSRYESPLRKQRKGIPRYMTFEPDGGGWNNIRMSMETVVGLAAATGRILVLPPQKRMYLLRQDEAKQRTHFDFNDFFPMSELAEENAALDIITMKEFLDKEGMSGNLRNRETGQVSFPPNNRTEWNGMLQDEYDSLREWLRTVARVPQWDPDKCLAAFPANGDHKSVQELQEMQQTIHKKGFHDDVSGDPVPVDAQPIDRMKENLAGRKDICVYDEEMQNEFVVHFAMAHKLGLRLLTHFYSFLFMEDWREDLWLKRFMRDHMRYIDEIQCAAARIVQAMRKIAKNRDPEGNPHGHFDTFHIRRGDFQYKNTRIEATEIYENSKDQLTPNTTIYIATDERNKAFFDPLRKHYDIWFLDDFKDAMDGVNTNYYGMIDQLVASRGRIFWGCWFSTFSGFIFRMRAYRSIKDQLPGYEKGVLPTSYYYVPTDKKLVMHTYQPLVQAFFSREFPTSWRDIDKGIGLLD